MQTANLCLLKDARNKDVILYLLYDKIEEIAQRQAAAIEDDLNALRFLSIISNFKQSNFGTILKVCPSVSNTKYINVKNLFQITLAIRCQALGLPVKY